MFNWAKSEDHSVKKGASRILIYPHSRTHFLNLKPTYLTVKHCNSSEIEGLLLECHFSIQPEIHSAGDGTNMSCKGSKRRTRKRKTKCKSGIRFPACGFFLAELIQHYRNFKYFWTTVGNNAISSRKTSICCAPKLAIFALNPCDYQCHIFRPLSLSLPTKSDESVQPIEHIRANCHYPVTEVGTYPR